MANININIIHGNTCTITIDNIHINIQNNYGNSCSINNGNSCSKKMWPIHLSIKKKTVDSLSLVVQYYHTPANIFCIPKKNKKKFNNSEEGYNKWFLLHIIKFKTHYIIKIIYNIKVVCLWKFKLFYYIMFINCVFSIIKLYFNIYVNYRVCH